MQPPAHGGRIWWATPAECSATPIVRTGSASPPAAQTTTCAFGDGETFEQVASLIGHEDYVYSLAWRADSQQLISGSGDITVRIWDTQALVGRIEARRDRQAILMQVEPMVQQPFAEVGEPGKVVEHRMADTTLGTRPRQVALQVTLRFSIEQEKVAARPEHKHSRTRSLPEPNAPRRRSPGSLRAGFEHTGALFGIRLIRNFRRPCPHDGFGQSRDGNVALVIRGPALVRVLVGVGRD